MKERRGGGARGSIKVSTLSCDSDKCCDWSNDKNFRFTITLSLFAHSDGFIRKRACHGGIS